MRLRTLALVLASALAAGSLSSVAVAADAPQARKAKTSFAGDGTYRVGVDIRPGTYVSTTTSSFGGYWERLSCATGELDCIISNSLTAGQSFVTIEPTDQFFTTKRMGTWRLASKVRPKKPATQFAGVGMYRVGIDIAPGTYVSTPTSSLGGYWERLSCATGELDCIISNDNVTGQTIVTIEPTDKYFSSSRMGTWKKG